VNLESVLLGAIDEDRKEIFLVCVDQTCSPACSRDLLVVAGVSYWKYHPHKCTSTPNAS
jgi:hypothetical protein